MDTVPYGGACGTCGTVPLFEQAGLHRCPHCERLMYAVEPKPEEAPRPAGPRPAARPAGPWRRGEVLTALFGDVYTTTDLRGGAMGVVLVAYGERGGPPLAFKTYATDVEYRRDDFRREAEVWIGLGRHENVVEARALTERDGRLFIVLEYVPAHPRHGTTLRDWIETGGLDRGLALELAAGVARGMEHAQRRSGGTFVHRDLKAENVLVHPDGLAKVTDFGISRSLPGGVTLRTTWGRTSAAGTTTVRGTASTMSPEQWTEGAAIDVRSDVYSFGCVLFTMIAGRPPFLAEDAAALRALHCGSPAPRLRDVAAGVPEALDDLVARCLAKRPDGRPADFTRVRTALEAHLGRAALPDVAPAPEGEVDRINRAHDLLILERAREALELLEAVVRQGSKNPTAFVNRGAARGKLGDLQGELEDLNRALDLDPRCLAALRNRGRVRLKLKDFAGAAEDFEAAHALLPPEEDPSKGPRDRAVVHYNRGLSLLAAGRFAEAAAALDEALRSRPDFAEAWTVLGFTRIQLRDNAAAIQAFDRALEIDPKTAMALGFRALARNQAGDPAAAEADADAAIRLDPSLPEAWNERAVARFARRDFQGCADDGAAAIRLKPGEGMMHLNRANALLELGRLGEAAPEYAEALRLGLPEPWDRVARAGLQAARGGGA